MLIYSKLNIKLSGMSRYITETAKLLVLIDFCPVQSELFTWNSVTKTFAILPANIIKYQIQA